MQNLHPLNLDLSYPDRFGFRKWKHIRAGGSQIVTATHYGTDGMPRVPGVQWKIEVHNRGGELIDEWEYKSRNGAKKRMEVLMGYNAEALRYE